MTSNAAGGPPPAAGSAVGPSRRRRTPTQQRSRERVEAILAAAHDLVVEQGSDAVKMSEVAARAGVPIGSVYQYFPDKPAILRELALRFMLRVRGLLADALAGLTDREQALDRVDAMLTGYFHLVLHEPHSRDVWAATQADKELQALDVEDSRTNGRLVLQAIAPLVPHADQEQLDTATFLIVHLSGAAARLAIAVGSPQAERILDEMRVLVRGRLEQLLPATGD